MNQAEYLKQLMLFNEKAEKLQDLSFMQYMLHQKSGGNFSGERVSEDSG